MNIYPNLHVKFFFTTLDQCKSNSNSWQGEKGRARRAGASKSGTVRKMKMYREQVSCVVARGDITVAVVMKDSPVWSCHGDGTQGAESQQEAAGETGHSRDRKSTSALMGTYRSLRRRAVQERYTITTHNTTLHAYADLKKGWILTNHFFYIPKQDCYTFTQGPKYISCHTHQWEVN